MEQLPTEIMNKIVMKGDLSNLNEAQKLQYYGAMCERLGIDPMTQPFQLLNLQGKHVLYCTKSGAEQLNKKYNVSHEIRKKENQDGVYVVEVRASTEGRFCDEIGAVYVASLKGDGLVNGMLKAVTKGKRRATLALLGLGMLDESEVETIPNSHSMNISPDQIAKIKNFPKELNIHSNVGGKVEVVAEVSATPIPNIALAKANEKLNVVEITGLEYNTCSKCKNSITSEKVFKYSIEHFNKPLCFTCQTLEKYPEVPKEESPIDFHELKAEMEELM